MNENNQIAGLYMKMMDAINDCIRRMSEFSDIECPPNVTLGQIADIMEFRKSVVMSLDRKARQAYRLADISTPSHLKQLPWENVNVDEAIHRGMDTLLRER